MSRGQILPAEGLSSGCLEQFGSTLTMTPIVVVDPSLVGDIEDLELNFTDVVHPSFTFKMEGVQFESTGVINPNFMVTEEGMDSESPHDSSDDNDNVFSDACCITSEDVSQMCHDHAATSPSSSCSSEEDQASDCVIIHDCALPVHGLTIDDTSSDSTIPFPEYSKPAPARRVLFPSLKSSKKGPKNCILTILCADDQLAMELLALPDISLCMLMPIAPPVRPEGEDVFPSDDGWTMVNAEGEPVQVPLRQQRARGRCVRK